MDHENPQVGQYDETITTLTTTGYIQIGQERNDIDFQVTFSISNEVTTQESITTPAGTFNTFKIVSVSEGGDIFEGSGDWQQEILSKTLSINSEGKESTAKFY